jgi:nitrite reductase/ring-hydroxylating ferredoxin subunit/uncharacterized membrane protein
VKSKANLSGHPIHPMLVGFPVAYLLGSAAINLWARASGKRRLHQTARDLNTLGLATACAAAVPGVVDYFLAVPPQSSAKERATKHALSNVAALALFSTARAGRNGNGNGRPAAWTSAFEVAGAALMTMAGWMGGTLVYRNQIGVDHRYADAGKWREERIPAAYAEGDLVDVASDSDLEVGQMKLFRIGDLRVALARTDEGYRAFQDRCTHRGGPLSDGVLICGTVQCPWHGSQFDVATGEVKAGPAAQPIETYPVQMAGGRVLLELPVSTAPAIRRSR